MANTQEFFKRLGQRIREIREAKGWTGKQINERGFNPTQWQQIEAAYRTINISTLLNVCEVLEVDLKTLLSGLDDDGIYTANLSRAGPVGKKDSDTDG